MRIFLHLMCSPAYNIYDFFPLGHIHLFWLWEVVPKEKGRFYIWIPVSGGQRLELKLNNKETGVLMVHSTRRWISLDLLNCQSACMRVEEKWRNAWSLLSLYQLSSFDDISPTNQWTGCSPLLKSFWTLRNFICRDNIQSQCFVSQHIVIKMPRQGPRLCLISQYMLCMRGQLFCLSHYN